MIRGVLRENMVYVDDVALDLAQSIALVNHSPTGFSWGYLGSGPSQLALALLMHFGATDKEALAFYQDFKNDVIGELPQTDFEINNGVASGWLEFRRVFATEYKQ